MAATTERKPNVLHGGDWTVRYRPVVTEGVTPSTDYTEVGYLDGAPTIPGPNHQGAFLARNGRRAAAQFRPDSQTFEAGFTATADAINAFPHFKTPLRDETAGTWAGLSGADISAQASDQSINASTTDLSGWPLHVPTVVDFPTQGRVAFVALTASATKVTGLVLPALVDESAGGTVTAHGSGEGGSCQYLVPSDDYYNTDMEFANVRGGAVRYAVHAKDCRMSNVVLSGAVDAGVQLQVSGQAQSTAQGSSTYGTGTVTPYDATSRPLGVNRDWLGVMTKSAAGGDLLPMNVQLTFGGPPQGLRAGGHGADFILWKDIGVPVGVQLDITAQIGVSNLVAAYAASLTSDQLLTGWGDGTNYLMVFVAELIWSQAGWQPNADGDTSGLTLPGQAIDQLSTPASVSYAAVSLITTA